MCVRVCVRVMQWSEGQGVLLLDRQLTTYICTYVHSIVHSCLQDRHVLVVISIEKLLEKMKKNNELLELILKVP